ncbi:MAG: EAL domain-containing protein [Betaproteobacteria bacterium]|nr:EAL domain-containing protein [Betaproteobacteria bacterium]
MSLPSDDRAVPTGASLPQSGEAGRELQRLNRALRTLSAGNRMLLRAADEAELLQGMCSVIVEQGGYRMSCVAYAQQDEQKSISLAAFSLATPHDPAAEKALRNPHAGWGHDELGRSATGVAIRTGEPCVGRNLLTDPNHAPWRNWAVRFGYASVSAFPLSIDRQVIGALVISASEPDAFDEAEVRLLGELADDLAYGIGNLRMRLKHRQAEATIHLMAYSDALTGLPNRAALHDQLKAALAVAVERNRPLALLLISLDHLKEINDTLGYAQGDRLLQAFASRLAGAARPAETVARVGEAEFALLLPQTDADHAMQTAQRLVGLLHGPIEVDGLEFDVHTHTGIALFPGHGAEPDLLLRRARVAMFDATRAGRDHAIFTPNLDHESARRLALMGDLRRAIDQNELVLYCQPKLHLASAEIRGAEALLRWHHPTQGVVPTGEFVKLAEQVGLITPLTTWVLEAAFQQRYAWHAAGFEQPLSVNLSAHDLRDPTLLDKLKGLFATWGAQPDWIQFELTESALMDDPAAAIHILGCLKQLGIVLFIDDFGIGYSSLGYLHRLPVDALKIDQSFVIPVAQSMESAAIVGSAVELGHKLGLEVVAEGVETHAAWQRVTELGCDVAQGFYVGTPMPAEQFKAWVAASPWLGAVLAPH